MTDRQFRDRRWEMPDMTRLIEVTELSVDPKLAERAPGSMPSRIRVSFADGSIAEKECLYQPGHSFADRGLDEAVVHEKFTNISRKLLADDQVDLIRKEVTALDAGSIDRLMTSLRNVTP